MERFKHQQEIFQETKDKEFFALLWEMRVGKTFPMIDTADDLFFKKKIDTVIVVAPNGVHLNWSRLAIPQTRSTITSMNMFPDATAGILGFDLILEWSSQKAAGKKYQESLTKALKHQGLLWLCCNIEASWTNKLFSYLEELTKERRCLLIVDESHKCKTPSSNCTKAMLQIAKACPYRRILTGTPATQGPMDLWSQFGILDYKIFNTTFTAFKNEYAYWKHPWGAKSPYARVIDTEQGDRGYKNLDKLYAIIKPHSSRLTQAEVFENLPELVQETRFFEMSKAHRRVYDELRDNLLVQLDSGETLTAPQAIVALVRLQQISRGFTGGIDDPEITDLGSPHPSIEALLDVVEQAEGKIIIWCRFRADVDLILKTLNKEGFDEFVRYDGSLKSEERAENLSRFMKDSKVKGIVGTPASGGIGVDISAADTMIFYSHSYNLGERLQAIARMQGPNQKSKSLLLVDIVAVDTADERCLQVLSDKKDLASVLTGDNFREILKNGKS